MFSFKALQFSHWFCSVFIVYLFILLWQLEACFFVTTVHGCLLRSQYYLFANDHFQDQLVRC